MSSRNRIVIGTRKSRLALAQTQLVAAAIGRAHADLRVELHPIVTQGDIKLDKPLPLIGGKGLFTSELEQALLSGQVDLAVHSAKDLPTGAPSGLDILCVPPRAAVSDVLVSRLGLTLWDLPVGGRVGTSSLRRQLQLQAIRPDLQFADIRGNIDTRANKACAGQYDAVVLAQAGLVRAGMTDVRYTILPIDRVLPAPGQAALALQGRADDTWLRETLAPINDPSSAACLAAERSLLEQLALDCQMPFAALCEGADGAASLGATPAPSAGVPSSYRLRTWMADPKTTRSIRTDTHADTWEQAVGVTLDQIHAAGGQQIIETFRQRT